MTYNLLWGVPTICGVLVKGSVKVRRGRMMGQRNWFGI
jgi:hypothetical protein